MSFIFGGGGGGGGGGATTGTQTTIAREAPEVEARKLSLYDEALRLAQDPVQLPGYQVAPPSALEQTGFGLAGTGVGTGASAVTSGLGQLGTAMQAPTTAGLSPYFNPYESYVTDEINRQSSMRQNELSAQAVQSGAFGGARQGVASAELDRGRLNQIGQLRAQGFQTALGGFQRQQQMGMAGAQMYGQLGQQQQAMGQADISSVMQAGGIQRQLGQQALEAQRMTGLQRQYEPYQRLEFMKGLMTNLPTGQSAMTATTAPGTNPLAQAAGAGIGAYAAYQMANRPQQIKMV
jgi:hypothetical protein